jgi:hypothetical protein
MMRTAEDKAALARTVLSFTTNVVSGQAVTDEPAEDNPTGRTVVDQP